MTAGSQNLIFCHGTGPAGKHYVSVTIAAIGATTGPFSLGDLTVDPTPLIRKLGEYGVVIKRALLIEKVTATAETAPTFDVASNVGWHRDTHYVYGNSVISPRGASDAQPIAVALSRYDERVISKFRTSGTLKQWNKYVGPHLQVNSRAVLSCGAVFSGPLLSLTSPPPSGGFQHFGASGKGKTAVLVAAASIMGHKPGSSLGAAESWRNTPGFIEKLGHCHGDGCVSLDEAHHAKPESFHEVVFSLSESEEKGRLTNAAVSRTALNTFLSTSNKSAYEIMATTAQSVDEALTSRILDIPYPKESDDIFDDWSGFDSGAALADHLKACSTKYYGTPFVAYLRELVECRSVEEDALREKIAKRIDVFRTRVREVYPTEVLNYGRAIDRGGLAYAALAFAIDRGVLPWKRTECLKAILSCIVDGLDLAAKTHGSRKDPLARVIEFLRKSKQQLHDLDQGYPKFKSNDVDKVPGYVKRNGTGSKYVYLTAATFARLVPSGSDRKSLMKGLVARGMSEPPTEGQKVQRKLFDRGQNVHRVYSFAFDLLLAGKGD